MKPEEAIQFIDSILATVQGTRADHIKLQTAVQTIQSAIIPMQLPFAQEGQESETRRRGRPKADSKTE